MNGRDETLLLALGRHPVAVETVTGEAHVGVHVVTVLVEMQERARPRVEHARRTLDEEVDRVCQNIREILG